MANIEFVVPRYLAQVQVASIEPIQLVLEATVGANSLGNIGIDNISFRPGTCPSKRFFECSQGLELITRDGGACKTDAAASCSTFEPTKCVPMYPLRLHLR